MAFGFGCVWMARSAFIDWTRCPAANATTSTAPPRMIDFFLSIPIPRKGTAWLQSCAGIGAIPWPEWGMFPAPPHSFDPERQKGRSSRPLSATIRTFA